MNEFARNTVQQVPYRFSALDEAAQESRKKRLLALLNKGLPTLPQYLLDLNALLGSPTVELKSVGKVIRTDPSLSAQVLRLCNSALFGLRRRVISIDQAAVLLGTERLRTLVLTCSVMQLAGKSMPAKSLLNFWQHSFLAALLSERIARVSEYSETEQAYLGGLLHDISLLPLWMLALDEAKRQKPLRPENWPDNLVLERAYFGMDHGKVGRWMALAWNFMPSFLDVFEHHHDPQNAEHDPYLVGIVAAADGFLRTQESLEPDGAVPGHAGDTSYPVSLKSETNEEPPVDFLSQSLPLLSDANRQAMLEMLQTEYIHLLPLVQLGLAAITPDSSKEEISVQEQVP